MVMRKSKIIFSGLEGSGKSLLLASYLHKVVSRNASYYKKTGIPRPIRSNMLFSDSFIENAKKQGIPVIYWSNLSDIAGVSGCDIVIDEIGTYFDSRLWTELSLDVRRWLAQCDKNGVNIYGTAQDFAQVDKSFRRLTSQLLHVTKLVGSRRPHSTYPSVRYPWGIFMVRDIDPRSYSEDDVKMDKTGLPSFFLLHKENYSIFNTNQSIAPSSSLPLKHSERVCSDCGYKKVSHL